jgi:hypothetical protein
MVGRIAATTLALIMLLVVACDIQRGAEVEDAPVPAAAEDAPRSAPPSARPPRNLSGDPAPPPSAAIETLERLDLGPASSLGAVTIEASDSRVQQEVGALIDGNADSLAISGGTNPVILTVTLPVAVELRAARVYLAASHYDWVLEPLPGEQRLLAGGVSERAWSQIELLEPVETSVVRLEILRLERDDFVHIGEIELYSDRAP